MGGSRDRLVYLGTIDDVLLRFPWRDLPVAEGFFRETLIDHVLFGNPLLINDGYLVNHPLARRDLLEGENSLILALAQKGFIKILSRSDSPEDLAKMPANMATDVHSFQRTMERDDWRQFECSLKRLGEHLGAGQNNWVPWPSVDMGDGFRVLLENISKSIASKGFESLGFSTYQKDAVRRVFDTVGDRLGNNTSGARTFFEQQQAKEAQGMPEAEAGLFTSDMMGLASELYHYNFGIHLDHSFRQQKRGGVITETRFSRAFDDLLAMEEDFVEIEGSIPIIEQPDLVKTVDPKVLSEIVDPATEIGRAKNRFLAQVEGLSSGKASSLEVQQAGALYKQALIEHFAAATPDRWLERSIPVGLAVAGGLAGGVVSGVGAGIGLAMLSSYVGEPGLKRLLQRARSKQVAEAFEAKPKPWKPAVKQSHVRKAMIGVLRFEPGHIDPIAKKAKHLG
ncbi:MAG: hypothetical protein ACWA5X_06640 [bacterium]